MPKYRVVLEGAEGQDEVFEVETDAPIPDDEAGRAWLTRELLHQRGQTEKAPPYRPPSSSSWSWPDKLLSGIYGEKPPFQYAVELEGGSRLVVDLPFELPPGPQGEQLLAKAVQDKLTQLERPKRLGRQAVGGLKDWVQGTADVPFAIGDTVLAFVNPQPPGAPRQPQPYRLATPVQLPPTEAPQTGGEAAVRWATRLAPDVLTLLGLPGVRRLVFGEVPTVKPTPLLFEPQAHVAKPHAGWPAVRTTAAPAGPLTQPLSEGAVNVSRLLGLPDTVEGIAQMSQSQAAQARGVLQRAAAGDPALLTDTAAPLGQLYLAIEQRLLSFR